MKDNLMFENTDYRIFFEFIKNYSGRGFANIDNQDQSIIRLNRILSRRRQFFYIADLLKFKILYTSPQILDIFGVSPEDYDLSHNFRFTHPLDIERRSRVRVKVIESGQELFIRKSGNKIISSNFRMKNITGVYSDILMQCYLFYCNSPIETVYILMVHTPASPKSSVLVALFRAYMPAQDFIVQVFSLSASFGVPLPDRRGVYPKGVKRV